MKGYVCVLCLLAACGCMRAQAMDWQPSAGHTQVPIWPERRPMQPGPGPENVTAGENLLAESR